MKRKKIEPIKTVLTISMGFLIIYSITQWKWAIGVSLVIGLLGLLSSFLAKSIDFLWMKLAFILGLIVPNILLSIIFFLFLFPISLISRLFRKDDPMMLKNNITTFIIRNKSYSKVDFEKPW